MKILKSLLRIAGLLAAILLLLAGAAATFVYFKVQPSRLQLLMWSGALVARYNQEYHKTVSPAEAVEDMRTFFTSLERVHPEPSGNIGPLAYAALKENAMKEAQTLPVKDGKVQVSDLAYLLYKAAAGLKDGHTSVQWRRSPSDDFKKKIYPPVTLGCVNGEFRIASFGHDLNGRRLTAINSVPVREFLGPILERQSAETGNYACLRFTTNEAFWWDISGLLSGLDKLTLTTEGQDGKREDIQLPLLSHAEFRQLGKTYSGRGAAGAAPLTLYTKEKTAWFYYPSFQYSEAEKERISAVFAAIKKAGVQELVIDIADNGGGDTRIGDFILTHLTDKPFISFSRTRWKISKEGLRILGWLGLDTSHVESRVGEVLDSTNTAVSHPRAADYFSGKTYLLVSGTTFSSATDFATVFRDYGLGKIIGWETGGVPVCFGESIPLTLPRSRIPFTVSDKQFFGPKPRPGDNIRGVMPDIPLTAGLLKKYRGDTRRAVLLGILKKRSMDSVTVK
ncbi:MAG TPA: hypothetical protein DEQ38_13870 [Elusimicrobia bacterium]|nr:MAG: hypothetical protein A2089_01680 [Elusimicrobia bacterium GWD2_63_28]HCC49185.1 hypothetical protein [Elusimicrobiota bacterium]